MYLQIISTEYLKQKKYTKLVESEIEKLPYYTILRIKKNKSIRN